MSSLEKHIEAMKSDILFEGTDFKLASCDGPSDERIARECGFTDLSVRVVKVRDFWTKNCSQIHNLCLKSRE